MSSTLLPESRQSSQQNLIFFMMMIFAFFLLQSYFAPPPKPPQEAEVAENQETQEEKEKQDDSVADGSDDSKEGTDSQSPSVAVEETKSVPSFATLGSMDPNSPYRFLVTLTNKGAAVSRMELNESKYREVQDRTGYFGQIVADINALPKDSFPGCFVQVLGKGTPAEKAGLKVGDRIVNLSYVVLGKTSATKIENFDDLRTVLLKTRPGDRVEIEVLRPKSVADTQGPAAEPPAEETEESVAQETPAVADSETSSPEKASEEQIAENFETLKLETILGEAPINIVRPIGTLITYEQYNDLRGLHGYDENRDDQLSYLCTLSTIDNHKLEMPKCVAKDPAPHKGLGVIPRDQTLDHELPGVELRRGLWELVQSSENEAVFRKTIPKWNLEVRKTFRLAQKQDAVAQNAENDQNKEGSQNKENVENEQNLQNEENTRSVQLANQTDDSRSAGPYGAYHLTVEIEIKNLDSKPHTVAYMLDGPTGMPLEGAWYSPRKTGPGWGMYGIRDVVVKFHHGPSAILANTVVANDKFNREPWKDDLTDYIGIDTQFFQCTLMPNGESSSNSTEDAWHSRTIPIRVGEHNTSWSNVTDISFRTYSKETVLLAESDVPNQTSLKRSYTIFAGPKKPEILGVYGLRNTIYYGWFWFVAIPMLAILHFLKTYVVFHYGLAIIALTVCVRLLMFPMSRKQAINAAKNAALMPEMQKIKEKHKGDNEAQMRAQQELWKKHNFNPLSGCLGIFIQLPIFIGLYKSLSLDVELYGAPLISNNFWCNDLSAPDMLFNWSSFWNSLGWTTFNTGHTPGFLGIFALGPYFNLLPMFTIALFIFQQKVMMPPATDDNMRMQQKMMNYMMIFMGLLFFKVPSGLCVYFIASSLWGLTERKLIPKYEFKLEDSQTTAVQEDSHQKKSKNKNPIPTEKEQTSMLGEMWRKINEKANEPRTITNTKKNNPKKKNKKKGR